MLVFMVMLVYGSADGSFDGSVHIRCWSMVVCYKLLDVLDVLLNILYFSDVFLEICFSADNVAI